MNPHEMSWKARINRYAAAHGITAQVVLQNIMLERFLRRLAVSPYKEHFVLKGGVLVTAFVGLDYRNTMDIDMTLLHYSLHEDKLAHALNEIISHDIGDDTAFHLLRMESIRQDDEYGGLRIYMQAQSGNIAVPFSIDVSTGDAITPQPIETNIPSFFDALSPVRIWSYNVETVLAEKLETILRRGVLSTRPRDYYDVYILNRLCNPDSAVLAQALHATAKHRNSEETLTRWREIVAQLSTSAPIQQHWEKYQRTFPYAKGVDYPQLIETMNDLLGKIERQ